MKKRIIFLVLGIMVIAIVVALMVQNTIVGSLPVFYFGKIEATSNVVGAKVLMDNKPVIGTNSGKTPTSITHLQVYSSVAKKHTFVFKKDGYNDCTTTLEIPVARSSKNTQPTRVNCVMIPRTNAGSSGRDPDAQTSSPSCTGSKVISCYDGTSRITHECRNGKLVETGSICPPCADEYIPCSDGTKIKTKACTGTSETGNVLTSTNSVCKTPTTGKLEVCAYCKNKDSKISPASCILNIYMDEKNSFTKEITFRNTGWSTAHTFFDVEPRVYKVGLEGYKGWAYYPLEKNTFFVEVKAGASINLADTLLSSQRYNVPGTGKNCVLVQY